MMKFIFHIQVHIILSFIIYFISLFGLSNTINCFNEEDSTVILVHGAWTGGWIWDNVSSILIDNCIDVFTPVLAGMGERQHKISEHIDLETHANDIISLIERENLNKVILIGHSYGGMVISEVAVQILNSNRISKLIYLDALVPLKNESAAEIIGLPFKNPIKAQEQLGPLWWRLEQEFSDARFNQFHPTTTFFDDVEFIRIKSSSISLIYVWFEESINPPLSVIAEQVQKDRKWDFYTLPTSHYAMLTMPNELAELLLKIITE